MARHELPFAAMAIEAGGHARVGLEDNIYLTKGVLAKGSFELVAEVAREAAKRGRALASIAEARKLLRLPRPAQVSG
jgi:3-keto-5-aminohexanoate cleavage enzyme